MSVCGRFAGSPGFLAAKPLARIRELTLHQSSPPHRRMMETGSAHQIGGHRARPLRRGSPSNNARKDQGNGCSDPRGAPGDHDRHPETEAGRRPFR